MPNRKDGTAMTKAERVFKYAWRECYVLFTRGQLVKNLQLIDEEGDVINSNTLKEIPKMIKKKRLCIKNECKTGQIHFFEYVDAEVILHMVGQMVHNTYKQIELHNEIKSYMSVDKRCF